MGVRIASSSVKMAQTKRKPTKTKKKQKNKTNQNQKTKQQQRTRDSISQVYALFNNARISGPSTPIPSSTYSHFYLIIISLKKKNLLSNAPLLRNVQKRFQLFC